MSAATRAIRCHGRADAGQPRAGQPGRAVGRSFGRHDGQRCRPGAGHRARRQDRLRGQPGARAIGGMQQAHLNVEAVRHWATPRIGAIRCCSSCAASCWRSDWNRCGRPGCARSAPTTACCRSAMTGMRDYTFLDYQIQNLIPASYDEDPNLLDQHRRGDGARLGGTHHAAQLHRARLAQRQSIGDLDSDLRQGAVRARRQGRPQPRITICTCSRHAGGHMHPETIDAMITSTPTTSASSACAPSATIT